MGQRPKRRRLRRSRLRLRLILLRNRQGRQEERQSTTNPDTCVMLYKQNFLFETTDKGLREWRLFYQSASRQRVPRLVTSVPE